MEKQLTDFSHELPAPFTYRMTQLLGDESENFFNALRTPSPTSVRLNPEKILLPKSLPFPAELQSQVPWCEQAFYLKQRPLFTLDPCFHAGAYYVQEASSMFLQFILKQIYHQTPLRALDLCAAPGGKTTLLASMLSPDSLLVANEVIKSRANILKENVIKWGHHNIVVTNSDPRQFSTLKGAFDLLLVDAPCSGEGMFRKDPKAIEEWSENNLKLCTERQKRILSDAWEALAPGGHLIYSTCTYNPEENERILEWLLKKQDARSVAILHDFPGVISAYSERIHAYRFYPHRIAGEGFFIGVIQKNEGTPFRLPKEKRSARQQPITLPATLQYALPAPESYSFYLAGATYGILPRAHGEFIQYLDTRTNILYKGCELGEELKGKTKPTHALALYAHLQRHRIPTQAIDLQTAISYLKKEEIHFEAPQGQWTLLTYNTLPIGWVKEAGHRLNNYYPKEWRIRGDF